MGVLGQLFVLTFVGVFLQTECKGLTLIQVLKIADLSDAEIEEIPKILGGLSLTKSSSQRTDLDIHGVQDAILNDEIDLGEIDPNLIGKSCSHGKCEFCLKTKWFKACVVAELLSKNIGFRVTLTVNGHTLFKKEVSVANPPPICLNVVPGLSKLSNLCLELYDVNLKEKSACARLTFKIKLIPKKLKIKVGCFHFGKEDAALLMTGGDAMLLNAPLQTPASGYDVSESTFDLTANDFEGLLEKCSNGTCKFCIKKGFEACIQIDVLSSKIGFAVTVTLNGRVVLKHEITVPNPKPFCPKNIPVKEVTDLCLAFENINLKELSGDIKLSCKIKIGRLPPVPISEKVHFHLRKGENNNRMIGDGETEAEDFQYENQSEAGEYVQKEALDALKFISNKRL